MIFNLLFAIITTPLGASTCLGILGQMMTENEKQNIQVVLDQIEAFNAKDIESCLEYWADDLQVILMPEEEIVFSNKQQVREHLQRQFSDDGPSPVSRVIEKRAEGDHVYFLEEKESADGRVIKKEYTYLVRGGIIQTMWVGPEL
jgi:hypothetical protein